MLLSRVGVHRRTGGLEGKLGRGQAGEGQSLVLILRVRGEATKGKAARDGMAVVLGAGGNIQMPQSLGLKGQGGGGRPRHKVKPGERRTRHDS